jgi:hypothetical protein
MNALNERQQMLYAPDESINELIYTLNEQLNFNNSAIARTRPPPLAPTTSGSDRVHSPRSPATSGDCSNAVRTPYASAMDTYKLMQQLLANGTLIKEAVRRLELCRQAKT